MKQVRTTVTVLTSLAVALVLAVPVSAELQPYDGHEIAVRKVKTPTVQVAHLQARSPGRPPFLHRLLGCCRGGQGQEGTRSGPYSSPSYSEETVYADRSNRIGDSTNNDEAQRARQVVHGQAVNPNVDGGKDSSHSSDSTNVSDGAHDSKSSRSSSGNYRSEEHDSDGGVANRRYRKAHSHDRKRMHDTHNHRDKHRTRLGASYYQEDATHPTVAKVRHSISNHKAHRHDTKTYGKRITRTRYEKNADRGRQPARLAITENGEPSSRPVDSPPPAPPVSPVGRISSVDSPDSVKSFNSVAWDTPPR